MMVRGSLRAGVAAILLGLLAALGLASQGAGAQTAPGPAAPEALLWTTVAPAVTGCDSSNTTVSVAGGAFAPAKLVNVAPDTWASGVWLAAEPGVSLGGAAPASPCGYARWDGQGPEVQLIPQPVRRYVYRIDVGSFSAAAARRGLELELRVDNVARVRVNGEAVGATALCDDDGEDFATPISCPLSAFQGPAAAFSVPEAVLAKQQTPLVEIEVLDYGSYTGLSYTIRRGEASTPPPPPPTSAACAPTDNASCSLTVTVPKGVAAGTARYCYAPPDGEARQLIIPTAGGMVSITMKANSWVDAPVSSTGTIYYPNEFWSLAVDEIGDPELTRCPGAIPAG